MKSQFVKWKAYDENICINIISEYFEPLMTTSILKRAKEKNLFEFETIDFRKFTKKNMDMLMIRHMVVEQEWF